MGDPFRPFQQLLAVLPRESARFLPPAYQVLMLDEQNSPIIDFYPKEFTLDMNGKINPWEGMLREVFIVM